MLRLASGFSDFKFLVLSASFRFIPKISELKWPAENCCYSSSKDMKTHFQPKISYKWTPSGSMQKLVGGFNTSKCIWAECSHLLGSDSEAEQCHLPTKNRNVGLSAIRGCRPPAVLMCYSNRELVDVPMGFWRAFWSSLLSNNTHHCINPHR